MLTPLYLPAAGGGRFALYHPAQGTCVGLVIYLHPLAEEMNKARRMVALQARALAAAGLDVLLIDLLGCGDSSGDFGDATWAHWLQDALGAALWLRARRSAQPDLPLWWWGLRSGALLATEVARRDGTELGPCHFLFWQPAASGKTVLQQFLRLKTAGQLAHAAAAPANATVATARSPGVNDLRDALRQGESIEVAGYTLSPGLALGLEAASLTPPRAAPPSPAQGQRVVWLECSPRESPALLPASQNALPGWREAGYGVSVACVRGPAFWQTTEIEDAPELIATTTRLLTAGATSGTERAAV